VKARETVPRVVAGASPGIAGSRKRYFGTDGIRGRLGEAPSTPEFVLQLGWAAGCVLSGGRRGNVLIGKDTRISGYLLESALEAGLAAAGADVCLLGPMPTPAISVLTRETRACAGIAISASHNLYCDNGIKIFRSDGSKISDATEIAIEALMEEPCRTVASERLGKARRLGNAPRRYIEFCKNLFKDKLDLQGLRLVLDCAHGAAYRVAPRLFEELGAQVTAIGVEPDGLNINRDCGSVSPELMRCEMQNQGADLGIALDGDGDRVIMADERGELLDGDELLYVIASARRKELAGTVVGTVMSNLGLEQALRRLGLELHRTPVGDRYIAEALLQRGLKLGGEPSGHIISMAHMPTGDGIVSALQVLDAMRRTGRSLCHLKSGMRKFPQQMINIRTRQGQHISSLPEIQEAVAGAEDELGDAGRVVLRPSGTEPVLRILVEGPGEAQVENLADRLAGKVREALERMRQAPLSQVP